MPAPKPRTPRSMYCCTRCDFRSFSRALLRKHKLKHLRNSSHKCRLCNFSAQSAHRLAVHVSRHHSTKFGRRSASLWTFARPTFVPQCRTSGTFRNIKSPSNCAAAQPQIERPGGNLFQLDPDGVPLNFIDLAEVMDPLATENVEVTLSASFTSFAVDFKINIFRMEHLPIRIPRAVWKRVN